MVGVVEVATVEKKLTVPSEKISKIFGSWYVLKEFEEKASRHPFGKKNASLREKKCASRRTKALRPLGKKKGPDLK